MPIKQENKKLYPQDWKLIVERIKERAGHKCEQCGVENYAIIARGHECGRDKKTFQTCFDGNVFCEDTGTFLRCQKVSEYDYKNILKVVLTVAHLDHDPTNNDDNNLKLLCQLHHNRYDREHRKQTMAMTRLAKFNVQTGDLFHG